MPKSTNHKRIAELNDAHRDVFCKVIKAQGIDQLLERITRATDRGACLVPIYMLSLQYRNWIMGGTLTLGMWDLIQEEPDTFLAVIDAVAAFSDFKESNDLHGEHDWFTFKVDGKSYNVKIDYYADLDFEYGAEDPTDPRTCRVLCLGPTSDF